MVFLCKNWTLLLTSWLLQFKYSKFACCPLWNCILGERWRTGKDKSCLDYLRKSLLTAPEDKQSQYLRESPTCSPFAHLFPGSAGLGSIVDVPASWGAHVNRDRHWQRGRGHSRYPSGKLSTRCFTLWGSHLMPGKGRSQKKKYNTTCKVIALLGKEMVTRVFRPRHMRKKKMPNTHGVGKFKLAVADFCSWDSAIVWGLRGLRSVHCV